MAEIDFDDELDDDLDEDIDEDIDLDFDEDEGGEGDDAQGEASEKTSFLTRRRIIIISAVIVSVFVLSAILFGLRLMGDKQDNSPKLSTQQGQLSSQNNSVEEKSESKPKKKKKKKIKYVKLYDLERANIADVLRELSYADITYKSEQRGKTFTVSVDQDEISEALNLLALKGLPASDKEGYALLDDAATLGVTEFDKKVRFVRALSGELEKAIIQIDSIDNAKVQIVLPKERLFSVTQPPVTAAILVRKKIGVEVNDDIVFGIIQIVANAVENLQQENVSVIDTEGIVLSNGIFERMALRDAGLDQEPEEEIEVVENIEAPSPEFAQPIIPNFDEINEWLKVKVEFETNLEQKASDQLKGVLPVGSYKIAISSELGPLNNGEIVDVRFLATSIVIDSNRDDIFVSPELKQQIFSTIAGSIGYVRGRDTIQLNLADFTLLSPEEQEALRKQVEGSLFWNRIRTFVLYPMIPVILGFAGYFGFQYYRRRFAKRKEVIEDNDADVFQDEIQSERRWDDIRARASQNPEGIAEIMEEWLSLEIEEALV